MVLFAKLSDETGDLNYRDARFDDVIALCDQVPRESELRPKAEALITRIQQGRNEAAAQDRESQDFRRQAEAAPQFVPQGPAMLPSSFPPAAQGGSRSPSSLSSPSAISPWSSVQAVPAVGVPSANGSAAANGSKPPGLPEWYYGRGYFQRPGAAPAADSTATPPAPADAPSPVAPASAVPTPASTPASTPAPPSQQPAGPPAVYGLPGPASRALILPPPTPQQ